MQSELYRSQNFSRIITRRRVIALGAGVLLTVAMKDTKELSHKKLEDYPVIDMFSHNADSLSKIENSFGIPAIELDVSQLPDGKLVVAHSVEDYYKLNEEDKLKQDPHILAEQIRGLGAKVHLDVKNVVKEHAPAFINFIRDEQTIAPLVTSTPHHEFLWNLASDEYGFDGQILFTLSNEQMVKNFLRHEPEHFKNRSFGVSINYEALNPTVSKKLRKDLGLYVLAWTPNNEKTILHCLESTVHGITSDNKDLLLRIGQNVKPT